MQTDMENQDNTNNSSTINQERQDIYVDRSETKSAEANDISKHSTDLTDSMECSDIPILSHSCENQPVNIHTSQNCSSADIQTDGHPISTALVTNEPQKIDKKGSLVFNDVKMITGVWKEFSRKQGHEEGVFLKGCKWSPDGTCLLTNSDDATMRLFDLPLQLYNCHLLPDTNFSELTPSLSTKHGTIVYDYSWYPLMTSMNPDTCCFVTTSFCAPVQLWDAFAGTLRCSYRGYNGQDELYAALSVAFNPSGDRVLCGYKNCVKVFHTDIPGRDCTNLSTRELCEQSGIVSCIAVNPSMPNIFAAGTYSKTVGLYSVDGHGVCLMTGQRGGLTQVMFSQDGSRLYTAGRKDPEILCWDLRSLGQILYVLRRPHVTNQRIYMDLSVDDQYLLSGSSDGQVYVWDLQTAPTNSSSGGNNFIEQYTQWRAHNDCVNGLSVHRHIPVVATASGQRYFAESVDDEDIVFIAAKPEEKYEDSVKIWWTGHIGEEKKNVDDSTS